MGKKGPARGACCAIGGSKQPDRRPAGFIAKMLLSQPVSARDRPETAVGDNLISRRSRLRNQAAFRAPILRRSHRNPSFQGDSETAWNGALQHGTRVIHIPRRLQASMPVDRHSMRLPARWLLPIQRISLALLRPARVQSIREVRQAAAVRHAHGGKSGPRRAGCRLTAGRREATESATESKPPKPARDGKGETAR